MKEQNKVPKEWISFRVKPEEYNKIYSFYQETACRKLSEYARKVLLQKPVIVIYRNQTAEDFLAEMNKLKNELSAIGNNFNQSVKRLHTLDTVHEIKTWAVLNESGKQILLKKVEEIRLRMNDLYQLWSRR